MPARITLSLTLALLLAGCFSTPSPEEKARMDAEKQEYCKNLREQIDAAKGNPLRRSTLERRYEEECLGVPACLQGEETECTREP